jgi:hypothetical protein
MESFIGEALPDGAVERGEGYRNCGGTDGDSDGDLDRTDRGEDGGSEEGGSEEGGSDRSDEESIFKGGREFDSATVDGRCRL